MAKKDKSAVAGKPTVNLPAKENFKDRSAMNAGKAFEAHQRHLFAAKARAVTNVVARILKREPTWDPNSGKPPTTRAALRAWNRSRPGAVPLRMPMKEIVAPEHVPAEIETPPPNMNIKEARAWADKQNHEPEKTSVVLPKLEKATLSSMLKEKAEVKPKKAPAKKRTVAEGPNLQSIPKTTIKSGRVSSDKANKVAVPKKNVVAAEKRVAAKKSAPKKVQVTE